MKTTFLKRKRDELGITLRAMAKKCHVPLTTLSTFERGTKIPGLRNFLKLYKYLAKEFINFPEADIFAEQLLKEVKNKKPIKKIVKKLLK